MSFFRRFFPKQPSEPVMVYGGHKKVHHGSGFRYSSSAVFQHPEHITIGSETFIWHYAILDGTASLTIGDGCAIGGWVGIFTHSVPQAIRLYGYQYRKFKESEKVGFLVEPVSIGAFCNIGPHVVIQHGCTIGKGCLIMPGCILSPGTQIPDFSIVNRDGEIIGNTQAIDRPILDRNPELLGFYNAWSQL